MKAEQRNIHELMVVDILHTGNMIDRKVSEVFKSHGLTNVQYNILRILRGALPLPLSVGEVKERILFSNSDITRLLDRLVSKKIVDRSTCPENRRKVHISITDYGLELLDELAPKIARALNNFYGSCLTSEEAVQLSTMLEKIKKCQI